jgi:ElaB/YqjD/DUF883 family membrane-anchored ribosome-binding protein
MANEPEEVIHEEVIRQQMADTRTALKDKLETLEQQVKDTVQGATDAVETVKDTVKETVETVKETVEETVQSVKETFNLSKHVQEHPWPAFACATAVGFVGGRLLSRAGAEKGQAMAAASPVPEPAPALYRNGNAGAGAAPSPPSPRRGFWSWLGEHYKEELDKAKGLAIATVGGVIREMVTSDVSPEIGERIKEVIDGFTTKLGAQPIKGPILQPAPRPSAAMATAPEQDFGQRWQRPAPAKAR